MNTKHQNTGIRSYVKQKRRGVSVSDRWNTEGTDLDTSHSESIPSYVEVARAEAAEVTRSLARPSRYRSLLVPVDGTPFGEHALPLALGIARRAGADVRLVHVHVRPTPTWVRDDEWDLRIKERSRAYLDDLVRRLERVTTVPVEPLLAEGDEVTSALGEVAGTTTDLVVMSTHGRGPIGRFWHGSVSDALQRQVSAPLLLVPGYDAPVDLTGDPVPHRVLMPLDGTESAEQVLGPALDLGRLKDAHNTLLTVVSSTPDYSTVHGRFWSRPPAGGRTRPEAWEYLGRLARRLGGPATRVDPRVLLCEEAAADMILWYARIRDVDLIALTTRGRGPLSRLLRGSVTEQVVRRANVPVLVVRTDE